eukprot:CAMPEP_0180795848 /NCGR_PEP_ID=MMETSP1038_2-20121128/56443_1 /TAXON_ID=632150 /ORGANISM="Azadinium spinosum, Strain 3D9" /LENGTH=53 /DNA_ID=CAMNT_0022834845 /DNA_START=228 /DNA_END=385 /DNA_ORIENTATION=-
MSGFLMMRCCGVERCVTRALTSSPSAAHSPSCAHSEAACTKSIASKAKLVPVP